MAGLPTIVVVDDAADLRALVRTCLRMSGQFDVLAEGSDGREAVDLVAKHRPDLLLLDVSMPGVDGLHALPAVRIASPETAVVMYSGFDEHGLAERARELGAAAYLQKSPDLDVLAEQLLEVLGKAPGDASSPRSARRASTGDPLLEEHLERFREAFEDAAIGMATVTLSGRIVRANHSLSTLSGYSVEDMVGKAYVELLDPSAASGEEFATALRAVVEANEDVVQFEHGLAGSVQPVRLLSTITPVRDARGGPLYLFVQVQDVTRQRLADEELRRSEERFRLLVETVHDYAIFMLDPHGHVTSWNAGAQRFKGYTADEIIGQHFRVFYPPEQQESRHPENELELALRDGSYEEEGWRVRKDGSHYWAQVTITPVHDQRGQLLGFAKVTRDTTERRRMLQEREEAARALADANERLQRAADDQAQFLAVTAHELRAPLGMLGMSAQMLQRHWADLGEEERNEFLRGMTTSTEQLNRLVADLLTTSKIQAKALDLRLSELNLIDNLNGLADNLRKAHPQAVVELHGDPELTIFADPGRLAQAMENLLTNAVRHGRSPVTVTVRAHEETVDIEVRDAGGGVSPEMVDRLFERFATGSRGGTGLGLYIVRELARAQGGEASYRPEEKAFVLTLPRIVQASPRPGDGRGLGTDAAAGSAGSVA